VSEVLESYRDGVMETVISESGKPEGVPSELADVVIRGLDLCGHLGIDLESAIELKHRYNQSRPFRHGNKRA
jgi:NTP pyrophosphatase (non-canonical NTP hydrolase)